MPLIATSIDRSGVVRIFFDMRAVPAPPDEQRRIAIAIEQAFARAGIPTELERLAGAD